MCGEPRPLSLKLVQPQKGGHFILRRYMWDLGAPWSDFCLWKKSDEILSIHNFDTISPTRAEKVQSEESE